MHNVCTNDIGIILINLQKYSFEIELFIACDIFVFLLDFSLEMFFFLYVFRSWLAIIIDLAVVKLHITHFECVHSSQMNISNIHLIRHNHNTVVLNVV